MRSTLLEGGLMSTISVIIPVYQGSQTIPTLAAELDTILPTLATAYEVIMVDDDSPDDSWAMIQGLAAHYNWLRGIHLMRNAGQHSALLCGIRAARYDVVVTMDDDGQHPPTEIATLLQQLDAGHDVIYGKPLAKHHDGGRNLGSWLVRMALTRTMGVDAAQHASAFRAFHTYLRDAFASYNSPYVSIDVLLSWGTQRFSYIEVEHRPRTVGVSNYNLRKLVSLAITMFTGFSALPLRIASFLGFFLTAFGTILLFYIIVIRIVIFGYDVPGFTFLASMIAIFSGAQMFTIGIIGEYLARIHFRTMDKPPYVVQQDTHRQATTEAAVEPLPTHA